MWWVLLPTEVRPFFSNLLLYWNPAEHSLKFGGRDEPCRAIKLVDKKEQERRGRRGEQRIGIIWGMNWNAKRRLEQMEKKTWEKRKRRELNLIQNKNSFGLHWCYRFSASHTSKNANIPLLFYGVCRNKISSTRPPLNCGNFEEKKKRIATKIISFLSRPRWWWMDGEPFVILRQAWPWHYCTVSQVQGTGGEYSVSVDGHGVLAREI